MENALYFPTINLPDDDWTFRTLLYWDKLLTVVPEEVARDDRTLSSTMVDLIQSELVSVADYWLLYATANAVSRPFVDYLRRLHRIKAGTIWKEEFIAQVHFQKMAPELREALQKYDVGHPGQDDWWHVRPTIARAYMSMLAFAMSSNPDIRTNAVTDRLEYLVHIDNSRYYSRHNPRHAEVQLRTSRIRNAFLRDLFPVPAKLSRNDIDGILRFKEQHGKALRLFRVEVEREAATLSLIEDEQIREASLHSAKERFKEQKAQAADAMRLSFGDIAFNVIVPATTNYVAYELNRDAGTAITGAGAILQAAYAAHKVWQQHQRLPNIPMGYAAFVSRRF